MVRGLDLLWSFIDVSGQCVSPSRVVCSPRKNPEEGRPHLYRDGNLKSLIVYEDCSGLFNIISYCRHQREVERFE